MATTLNAGTATSGAAISADTTGILQLQSGATPTTAVTIDTAQNVGIGTSSPAGYGKLTVYGNQASQFASWIVNANTSAGSQAAQIFSAGASANFIIFQDKDGIAGLYNAAIAPMLFYTAATERMRIDSSGNLLVGTTSTVLGGQITCAWNGNSKNGMTLNETANYNGATFIYFSGAGAACGNISRVGTTNAVVYATTSDYRLKNVVGIVSDAGERIDALEPIEYDFKTGGRAKGFLAHKFAEVYPNSVTGEKDAVDADGNPIYQNMQASTPEVMADLIAEIQSLRKRLTALEGGK